MVLRDTTITFQVEGRTAGMFTSSREGLRSGVIGILHQYFIVRSVEVTAPTILSDPGNYVYQALVTITTRMDYGHVDDIASVIANAFYVNGGALPTVSTDVHDGPFGVNYKGVSIFDTVGDVFEDVKEGLGEVANVPKLLVVGIIAIVAIVAFSPLGKAGVKFSAV